MNQRCDSWLNWYDFNGSKSLLRLRQPKHKIKLDFDDIDLIWLATIQCFAKLIFRASRPKSKEEVEEYKELLSKGLVKPTEMELFICDSDGSNLKQITYLGNANWSPFFHPSGEKLGIFFFSRKWNI